MLQTQMKRQRISLFIHENLSSFQYTKGKMLLHQNDLNVTFNNLPDTIIIGRVSKLAVQCHALRKKNMSK